MVHCPVCRKYWNDETNTNLGLCSLDCQTVYNERQAKLIVEERRKAAEALAIASGAGQQLELDHFWLR